MIPDDDSNPTATRSAMNFLFLIPGFLIILLIANGVYQLYRPLWPTLRATVISTGRTGVVTSHFLFDLIVEINTEATEAEKNAWIAQKKLEHPQDEEWVMETGSHLREWLRVWRWEVTFSEKLKYDPNYPRCSGAR